MYNLGLISRTTKDSLKMSKDPSFLRSSDVLKDFVSIEREKVCRFKNVKNLLNGNIFFCKNFKNKFYKIYLRKSLWFLKGTVQGEDLAESSFNR
jgi:hypothetical protein